MNPRVNPNKGPSKHERMVHVWINYILALIYMLPRFISKIKQKKEKEFYVILNQIANLTLVFTITNTTKSASSN